MVSIPRLGGPPQVTATARPLASPRGANPARPSARHDLPGGWALLRQRLSRLMLMSIALLIVGVVGLFQVLQTTRVAATGYDVSALEREQTALDADIRLLEAQIAAHSNLEQLREQATTRLGMVPADRQVHVSVDTPAPAIIPLPRRYVPEPERQDPPSIAWWEHVQARIPGLH